MKPASIRVLGRPYRVKYKDLRGGGKGGVDRYGEVDYKKHEIRVEKTLGPEEVEDTLMHEALHAADGALKIGLKENQVWQVTAAVMDIIGENPKVFAKRGKK